MRTRTLFPLISIFVLPVFALGQQTKTLAKAFPQLKLERSSPAQKGSENSSWIRRSDGLRIFVGSSTYSSLAEAKRASSGGAQSPSAGTKRSFTGRKIGDSVWTPGLESDGTAKGGTKLIVLSGTRVVEVVAMFKVDRNAGGPIFKSLNSFDLRLLEDIAIATLKPAGAKIKKPR